MKKGILVIVSLLFLSQVFAGGIVQNTNQSADYFRMMNRNSTMDVDATYFNPAGLTALSDGMHLYVSNQTIWQTRTIETQFPAYNENTFEGTTFAPVFPNLYFVLKSGKMAISAGFIPAGGGGSADFPQGLPSFDYLVAKVVGLAASNINAAFAPYGTVTGYTIDAAFEGSSIYYGGIANFSYAINDLISVAAGARYLYAANTYEGHLDDVTWIAENGVINEDGSIIPRIEVDAARNGSTIVPVIGLGLNLSEKLNIGFRYELKAELEMTNETTVDETGAVLSDDDGNPDPMFPDEKMYRADIPSLIAVGLGISPMAGTRADISFNFYPYGESLQWDWDEDNPANRAELTNSGFEIGCGVEHEFTEKLTLGAGYLYAASDIEDSYQTEQSNSLISSTVGLGGKIKLSDASHFSVSTFNTFYQDGQNKYAGNVREEIYGKTAFGIAFGFQKSF